MVWIEGMIWSGHDHIISDAFSQFVIVIKNINVSEYSNKDHNTSKINIIKLRPINRSIVCYCCSIASIIKAQKVYRFITKLLRFIEFVLSCV